MEWLFHQMAICWAQGPDVCKTYKFKLTLVISFVIIKFSTGDLMMVDFTETTTAEDFEMELSVLIEKYLNRGLSKGTVEEVTCQAIEDMFGTEEYVDGE
jgi:hypothetical protein